jgi:hypothetical protein
MAMASEDGEDPEEEDDFDDDEDDDVEPPRPAPVGLNRKDLAPLILRRFCAGWNVWQIYRWLKKKNIADAVTGKFLSPRQIGGYRMLLKRRKHRPEAPPAEPLPPAAPPPQPPVERDPACILRHLKRIVQFAANGDDPVLKTRALFKVGDEEDRKNALFLTIVGLHRLMEAARCVLRKYGELSEYAVYIMACDSPEGRAWITKMFSEIGLQARITDTKITNDEAEKMLETMESRIGFRI